MGDPEDPPEPNAEIKRSASESYLDLHQEELLQVARDGDIDELNHILNTHFLNLNKLDEKQNSALHYAARYSHLKTVKRLVGIKTVDVDVAGSDGMTPLHYASRLYS